MKPSCVIPIYHTAILEVAIVYRRVVANILLSLTNCRAFKSCFPFQGFIQVNSITFSLNHPSLSVQSSFIQLLHNPSSVLVSIASIVLLPCYQTPRIGSIYVIRSNSSLTVVGNQLTTHKLILIYFSSNRSQSFISFIFLAVSMPLPAHQLALLGNLFHILMPVLTDAFVNTIPSFTDSNCYLMCL